MLDYSQSKDYLGSLSMQILTLENHMNLNHLKFEMYTTLLQSYLPLPEAPTRVIMRFLIDWEPSAVIRRFIQNKSVLLNSHHDDRCIVNIGSRESKNATFLSEFRRSFSIQLTRSYLTKVYPKEAHQLYLVCALGSVQLLDAYQEKLVQKFSKIQDLFNLYLIVAIKYANEPVIEYLTQHASRFRITASVSNIILSTAAQYGYVDLVKKQIENHQGRPAAYDNYAIAHAAANGHLRVVKYLIEKVDPTLQVDPAARDQFAMRHAAGAGHLDVVKYLMGLVSSGYIIDPAAMNNSAIRLAEKCDQWHVVEYFIGLGAVYSIDLYSEGPLYLY